MDHVLRQTLAEAAAALASIQPPSAYLANCGGDWLQAHNRARDQLQRDVLDPLTRDRGLTVTTRGDLTRVTMQGITATCSHGTAGALRNWITAARKRLQEDAA